MNTEQLAEALACPMCGMYPRASVRSCGTCGGTGIDFPSDEDVEAAMAAVRGSIGVDLIDTNYCREVARAALEAVKERWLQDD